MEEFDFFKICKNCNDEECCAEPYYIFIAKNEIRRIQNKIKQIDFKILDNPDNFFNFEVVYYKDKTLTFRTIKKINDKCVFLKNKRFCIIQDVKPFDCKIWPLTYDYSLEENKLIIYLGACPLTDQIPELWIESTIEELKKELKKRDINELIAYSLLEKDASLKIIREIPNFL